MKSLPTFGVCRSESVQADQGLPSSSGKPSGLKGFALKPAALLAAPLPWEAARSGMPAAPWLSRTMCN